MHGNPDPNPNPNPNPNPSPNPSPSPSPNPKQVHREKLLLQAEEDRRRNALRLMREGGRNSAATGILASSLPAETPRGVASVAAAASRQGGVRVRVRVS